ncbi:SymE family type I addiction module toxin [Burkholderia seminalis]
MDAKPAHRPQSLIKISGRWLTHDVGFHAGQKLRVHVQHGKLTITAT